MLVDYILSQISFSRPYFVIGIDGPTAVGKSYLADMLAERLNEQKIHHFIYRLDWTLISRDLRENEIDLFVKKNSPFEYEASLHMDLSRASQFLADLQNNFAEGEIHQLKGLYNRDDDGRCTGKVEFVMEKNMVVIVEGHYTHHKSLFNYFDYNLLLLSKPEELLQRKILRAGDYRDENLIKSYFEYIDVPSFVHYLDSVHNSVSSIFDNTDYTKPKEISKHEMLSFRTLMHDFCCSKQNILIKDLFSESELRNRVAEKCLNETLNQLFEFDFEASKLYGLAENIRELSFSDLLSRIINNSYSVVRFANFKSLYSEAAEYFLIIKNHGVDILFYSTVNSVRVVVLSEFTNKCYDIERVFGQFSTMANWEQYEFSKVEICPQLNKTIIVPDELYVNHSRITTDDLIISIGSQNLMLCFQYFLKSEFELIYRFEDYTALDVWSGIFSKLGCNPMQRDNYLYVNGNVSNDLPVIDSSLFSIFVGARESSELSVSEKNKLSDAGFKYFDGVVTIEWIDAKSFIDLFYNSSLKIKQVLWDWLLRNFSAIEIFPGVDLKRLYRNLPSTLNDYYFALSLGQQFSVPFFTVYDMRSKSIDISAYFNLAVKHHIALGVQASQNALDSESGYLCLEHQVSFASTISHLLIDFLVSNPEQNIPLWSAGIDHASAKMNKSKGWTKSFIKESFDRGFLTSICLDIEGLISRNQIDFSEVIEILNEWLSVIPHYADIELATGENVDVLNGDNYNMVTNMLSHALISSGFEKSTFLLGPALGTVHHAKSQFTNPSSSQTIFNATRHNGNIGNVLHGTSFTSESDLKEFVKNNCIRVNFAGQYLSEIVNALPSEIAVKFGDNQVHWKRSFAGNKLLLDNLDADDYCKISNSIEDLFLRHNRSLNVYELSEKSALYFHRPVSTIPLEFLEIIANACLCDNLYSHENLTPKPILLASMIEIPDEEFMGGLAETVYNAGIRGFHIDVGDGKFINRLICGLDKISFLKRNFKDAFIHVHLMAFSPEKKSDSADSLIETYCKAGINVLYLYPESFTNQADLKGAIKLISSFNVKPGLVYNSDFIFSPFDSDLLQKLDIHHVQLMGVPSGRGGQKFVVSVMDNIKAFRTASKDKNFDLQIEIDGGMTKEIAIECRRIGVDFISGWSFFMKYGYGKLKNRIEELLYEV